MSPLVDDLAYLISQASLQLELIGFVSEIRGAVNLDFFPQNQKLLLLKFGT